MMEEPLRTGGQLVIDSLVAQGVTRMSCVPGESFLPVLDAVIDSPIRLDVCRHEAGAGNMAIATAKLTGLAGVAAVTRGPGAMHAAIAVHTAEQDAVPLILLVGQVALRDRGRGGFQEMDYARVFGSVAKWVTSLDTVRRIPETIARAVRIAESGRPGPVVIEMPEDVLADAARVPDVARIDAMHPAPATGDLVRAQSLLARAAKPLLLLGRGVWSQDTADAARSFAERHQLPTLAGFRCQDYVDNDSDVYCGHVGLSTDPLLASRLEEADLIVSVGGHFGDAETRGYEILSPRAGRGVVHVACDEGDVDRYLHADLAIFSTPLEFFRAMEALEPGHADRSLWLRELRGEEVERRRPRPQPGDTLSAIMAWLQDEIGPDAIVANGAGNYAIWVHRFIRYRRYGSQLAPASGAMGFGLPAGIAASLVRPDRPVVVFAGDGCLTMALPELATLIGSDARITIVVVNNGVFGTIRLHQERAFPGRVSGTDLVNPDFVALARSFGLDASRVRSAEEFAEAFRAARGAPGSTLIEIVADSDRSTPDITLASLRGKTG